MEIQPQADAETLLQAVMESGRMGPRMRCAVALAAAGVSYRAAARAVGFNDPMELCRTVHRYGLAEIHRRRQREAELVRRRNQRLPMRHQVEQVVERIRAARGPYGSAAPRPFPGE